MNIDKRSTIVVGETELKERVEELMNNILCAISNQFSNKYPKRENVEPLKMKVNQMSAYCSHFNNEDEVNEEYTFIIEYLKTLGFSFITVKPGYFEGSVNADTIDQYIAVHVVNLWKPEHAENPDAGSIGILVESLYPHTYDEIKTIISCSAEKEIKNMISYRKRYEPESIPDKHIQNRIKGFRERNFKYPRRH